MNGALRRIVVLGGTVIVTAIIVATTPFGGLSDTGHYALATAVFAASLWVTEALPLPVTALAVPVLLTGFGVYDSMRPALTGFADPVVFLLLAGFVLAAALSTHGVDRRLAYRLIAMVGSSQRRLVLALMVSTALLSMLISNTATTAMMAPIAIGVARSAIGKDPTPPPVEEETEPQTNVETAALLGVAYAASIGGVGTLVGTPPNAIVVGVLATTLDYQIGFLEWLVIGLPVVCVTLPVAWYLLVVQLYPPETEQATGAQAHAAATLDDLGPLSPAGRRVVVIAGATAALWLLGGFDFLFEPVLPPAWQTTLFGGDGPSVFGTGHQGLLYFVLVGLIAVVALFATDSVEWSDAQRIDWGTLVLLGGGLSLADALAATDAVSWLANAALGPLVGTPVVVLLLVVVVGTVLASELASNTAMVALLAPLLIDAGPRYADSLGASGETAAVLLAVTAAVAASFGFALPVATPPNAIVFGTGRVSRERMLKAGVVLDVVLGVLVTGVLLVLFTFVWPVAG